VGSSSLKAWGLSTVLGGLALVGSLLVGSGDLFRDALAEGVRFLEAGERDRAREAYERALALAEKRGDREGKFAALIGLGDSDPPRSDGKLALDAFRRARELAVGREAGVVEAHLQFDLGVRAAGREDLDRAAADFRRALAAARRSGERRMEARCLNALGNVALRRDELRQAEAFYREALRATRGTGDRIVPILAYHSLGDALFPLGQSAEALRHYEEALALARQAGHRRFTEWTLNAIGVVHLELADYGRALQLFQEALRTGTDDRSEIAFTLNNIGIVHGQQGNYGLGLEYFHRALRIAEEEKDDYARMRLLNNLGLFHQSRKQYGRAIQHFSRALRLAEAMKDRDAMAGHWKNLAAIHEAQGSPSEARLAYRKSLGLAESVDNPNLSAQALAELARLDLQEKEYRQAVELADRAASMAAGVGSREPFWWARTLAGRALHALGRDGEARRAYAEAISTVEQMRSRIAGGEIGKDAFLEARLEPYHRMIELEADRGETAAALASAERAKGRILLETLRYGRVDLASRMTPTERATEQKLRDRLATLNGEVFLARSKTDRGALRRLGEHLGQARRDLESFNANLYAARPSLRARRADFPAWDLGTARRLLAGGDARDIVLIEYTVLDDQTYLFTVTANSGDASPTVRLHRLPVGRAELAREVEAFRARLAARDLDFRAPAQRLYSLLLAPAAAEIQGRRTLCIVPDGPLWDLPFQALQPNSSETLLESHALHYAPSLSYLAELASRKARRTRPATLLAVGDARLPEAEREVQAVSRLYGPSRRTVYTAALSEERIKAEAGRHNVLHFATHALLDDHNPMYSSLVLSKSRSGEDGLLEAWEILDLHLDADLVVLAACQTARGRPRAGEGMIGMSWALAAAGSPATLASQWEVDSESTRRLMVEVHRGWLAGLSRAEALRRAALAVRGEERYRHPFYWAGFVLIGEGD
jgi:CHAT domain-containing protein/tetratricopeptide (TPR) repeat protein